MLGDSVRRRHGTKARSPRNGSARGKRSEWRSWLPWAAAAVAFPFVAGYAIATFVLFPPEATVEAGIAVPPLNGMMTAEAERVLETTGLGGLDVVELPHPAARAGAIIAQTPLSGQQLRPGERVLVAVSSGRPRATVPDVVGFEDERAMALLSRLGFMVEVRREESMEPEGRVLRLDPGPGSPRDLPSLVVLTVSAGPRPDDPAEIGDTIPGFEGDAWQE